MDLLFKNVCALTMAPDAPVLENAWVGVADGRIAYLAETPPEASQAGTARTIDGAHKVLMPGLYNCHCHTPMSLLRGYANDLALEEWLFGHIIPAEAKVKGIPNAVYTGAMLAIAEMVASGTIAFSDMYFHLGEIARAVETSGVKANLSNAVLAFDDDYDWKADNCCTETLHILHAYHNAAHGRIKAEASLHCAYTTNEPAWRQIVEFAHEHQLGIQLHLSETQIEHLNSLDKHGLSPAQAFARHGVFDRPTVAAHGCWVTDEDMDILAAHGVSVAHNPVSNLKLASGIAPVEAMRRRGINLVLGTDGMASNNSHDLFEEIKLASILQKCACKDPTALPARTVLEMATVNGAKAQGRQGGMLAVGLDADLVLLDLDNPRQTPCFDLFPQLAYATTGRDVAMTLCQGRILYEKGEYQTIDIEKIQHEARQIAAAL